MANEGLFVNDLLVKSEKYFEILKIFKILNYLNSQDFRISGILMYILLGGTNST